MLLTCVKNFFLLLNIQEHNVVHPLWTSTESEVIIPKDIIQDPTTPKVEIWEDLNSLFLKTIIQKDCNSKLNS